MKINTILQEIIDRIEELQELVKEQQSPRFPQCYAVQELNYVNLSDGTTEEKLNRIIEQIVEYNINIIPTPKDSQVVRSAIVEEIGSNGLKLWHQIRALADNYDEKEQDIRYIYLMTRRGKNNINFGAIVNLYKAAIDKYNNSLNIE